jgi:hypothetical protein
MQPRVVHDEVAREGPEQGEQGATQITAAEQPERLAVEQERVVVVGLAVERLVAAPDGGVRLVYAPRRRDGHPQRHLGHRLREDRRGRDHVDIAAVALLVIHIRQEVALDVGDQPQVRRPVQTLARQGSLPDDGDRLG